MSEQKIKIDMAQDLQHQATVLTLKGKLDLFSFKTVKDRFEQLAQKGQVRRMVIDLTGVSFIASSGWSVLLARRKMSKLEGGDVVIFGLNSENRRVYDSMKITELLPLAENDVGALEKLGPPDNPN